MTESEARAERAVVALEKIANAAHVIGVILGGTLGVAVASVITR